MQQTNAGPVEPFETNAELTPADPLDAALLRELKRRGLRPARLCSDAVFMRRAHVDLVGRLPEPDEAREFLAGTDPGKRHALVDALLGRPEFADHWAGKWCDLLRVKAEFPINLWPRAAQAYDRWVRAAVRDGMPLDRFARTLLTATGSNFRHPPANFYRAVQGRKPADLARAAALTFMGCRAERWPAARLAGMAAFFSQVAFKGTGEWKEEILYLDPSVSAARAVFPDGTAARVPAGADARAVFADWLVKPGNPWFARNLGNRAWAWLFGRGVVHEPDDVRPDNPPANPALLALLERAVAAERFDLRGILRRIATTRAYQLSSIPRSAGAAADACFAHYIPRRMDAEVLIDALNQVTGTREGYTSAIPEPFTFVPEEQRALELPDGSITSSFLEMFGRPARDTGLEAERNNRPSAAQRLHLLNSTHVQRKVELGPRIGSLIRATRQPGALADQLYLLLLSRYPTASERAAALAAFGAGGVAARSGALDVAWALINSTEFQFRH